MTRVSKVILVTEGYEDTAFARGFFKAVGIPPRTLEVRENPRGRGSGHDFVRKAFVQEVKNLQRFREGRGVFGMIDEDGFGAQSRIHEIEQLLRVDELPLISASQGRCVLVPVRNLETWVYWLRSHTNHRHVNISENQDFKITPPEGEMPLTSRDFSEAGDSLHRMNHMSLPVSCPGSLRSGLDYLRQFVEAIRR